MNSCTLKIISLFIIAVSAAPNVFLEDEASPILNITTCGGYFEASSATINFQVGGSIRADMRCVWVIQPSNVYNQFTLTSSGLGGNDGIYVATYLYGNISSQRKISVVGQNYTIVGRLLIITLSVGHAPTMGFSLSFSSSGESGRQVLTGYAGLTTASGNYSYPENGERYGNNEDALFLIAPTVPAQPTLRFTYVDIEFGSGCLYDQLAVFTWFDNEYKQTARFCGDTIPTSVTLVGGAGLVTFSSDRYNAYSGFKFEWRSQSQLHQTYQTRNEEDPSPILAITTCGGLIESSSAIINFQLKGSIRADMRCIWVVQAPYENQRFTLISSGLGENDGIYISTHRHYVITEQQKISVVGQNYTISAPLVIITFSAGHSPTKGFSLSFSSSGLPVQKFLTGYADLTTKSGNYSYPVKGNSYANNENAMFFVAPAVPGCPTLRFTFVDVEPHSYCGFDYVRIFTWLGNQYKQAATFCGDRIPPNITFIEGAGLVMFHSSDRLVKSGFKFEWV
ncbi:cubilin [Folsomia candida]|uniref:cubilin n=1 Tax=Folsomia candida TaxID=158441 RepID=UPI0016052291|nr:cubilin [Folsomia candida]